MDEYKNRITADDIKDFFFPKVNPDVQEIMDKERIKSMHRLSFAGMIFMVLALMFFILTLKQIDDTLWIRIAKFVIGFFICLGGFLYTHILSKRKIHSIKEFAMFSASYYLILNMWAVFVSYREYLRGEQLLIFFAVQLMTVCFIPLKPIVNIVLTSFVYATLYSVLYSIDTAKGINIRNCVVLVVVAITGMIAVYRMMIRMSERAANLKKAVELADYNARHDALTKLRNRQALNRDIPALAGKQMTVYMMDLNNFKELNDTYGHVIGDAVLQEAARQIEEHFCKGYCYRYGGDEFLTVSQEREPYKENAIQFSVDSLPDKMIFLSIGYAEGCPENEQQFFELVSQADRKLYETKCVTHMKQ